MKESTAVTIFGLVAVVLIWSVTAWLLVNGIDG